MMYGYDDKAYLRGRFQFVCMCVVHNLNVAVTDVN